jgi:deoxyribose-phosphate aldolase
MILPPSRFDHALLAPDRTDGEVATEAGRAAARGIRGFCVLSRSLDRARAELEGSATILVSVVNFPAGAAAADVAAGEAKRAVDDGAGEIDVVVPSGWLRAGEFSRALDYLAGIVESAAVPTKAIVESAFFDDAELARVAREVVVPSGAAFFKTGTGVYGGRLAPDRIRALRHVLPGTVRLKVSGGIRDAEAAAEALQAGADLLGTSRTFAILGPE